jgi:outer membrane lipoprotein-sorting protein
MNPEEKIKKLINESKITASTQTEKKILGDAFGHFDKLKLQTSPIIGPYIWRIIMTSQLTKIAAAAVVIIACMAGLTMFKQTSSVAIALDDVLTRIEQINSYMYQTNMTTTVSRLVNDRKLEVDVKMHGTVLVSKEYGRKETMTIQNPNNKETTSQETYLLFKEKSQITISHTRKSYTHMEYDDAFFEEYMKDSSDPHTMVEQILKCQYKSLGISTINGVKVEGFQTQDPNYMEGLLGKVDIKLWVDLKTQLPFKIERDIQRDEPMNMHISGVMNNFQWNVPIDAAEFEPKIPSDYTSAPGGTIKMPANNEETAIQGLKLYADLTSHYPKNLIMTVISPMREIDNSDTPAAKQLQKELEGLNSDERTQKTNEIRLPIQGAGIFYAFLIDEKKDPAYYGDIVKPENADQVLMRWKISDNDYRIIFGDLKVETVTYETLVELEKMLPK